MVGKTLPLTLEMEVLSVEVLPVVVAIVEVVVTVRELAMVRSGSSKVEVEFFGVVFVVGVSRARIHNNAQRKCKNTKAQKGKIKGSAATKANNEKEEEGKVCQRCNL